VPDELVAVPSNDLPIRTISLKVPVINRCSDLLVPVLDDALTAVVFQKDPVGVLYEVRVTNCLCVKKPGEHPVP
jgi:hypothetical protein